MVAVVSLMYFGAVYLAAWTALHQFTPVMILPLVPFWRIYLQASAHSQQWLLPAAAASTVLALVLSLPRHFEINLAVREFGLATSYRLGNYESDYQEAVRGGWSLNALLPKDYRLRYPEQPWGTDARAWIYYASLPKPPGARVNYVVQKEVEPAPAGASEVMRSDGVAVYVLDQDLWIRDRDQQLPRVTQSPLYEPILRRTYRFFREYAERMQARQRINPAR
jgi:hypothetical protein